MKSEFIGLMVIPPHSEDEQVRDYLAKFANLLTVCSLSNPEDKLHWWQAYDKLIINRVYESYDFTEYTPVVHDLRDLN
jgi:SNF2 family DNA or RNA helicase